MEEKKINRIEEKKLIPEGYSLVERGVAVLSRTFVWLSNKGGNIREGVILEPLNKESKDRLLGLLGSELEEIIKTTKDPEFDGINIGEAKEPLSEIIKGYRKHNTCFLTEYLKENHPKFGDGILVVNADIKNFPSPRDEVYLFGATIVENEPNHTLQVYCKEHNLKLLFLFDEWDYTKYLIYMATALGTRPISLGVRMLDTAQVENPRAFIDSQRVPEGVKGQWYEEIQRIIRGI